MKKILFILAIVLSFSGMGIAHAHASVSAINVCAGDSRAYESNGGSPPTAVIADHGHDTDITTESVGTCIWYHGCYSNWSPPGGGSVDICHLQFYPNGPCITWDSNSNHYKSETCASYEAKQQLFWQPLAQAGTSNYWDINAGSSEHWNVYRFMTAIFNGNGSQVDDEIAGAGGRAVWFIS